MNIRKTIISATVAVTMVAMIAPATAGALTIAELQAQINALMAQLAILQGTSTDTGGVPSACVGLTFTRNLTVGSTGSDVKCLQALMNTSSSTQVAVSGAGSPGSETSYFGSLTLVAVKKYQAQQGWTPANQVGPLTRAKLNAWLSGGVTSTPTPTPTPTPTGAGLSVMLASDNPASGSVVDASALHPMMKLVFTNGDNAEVKVTNLKLKRIGVSADASVTNTYLFKGSERLTDGAAVSTTMVTFNNSAGIFTVPAMGSVTITVMADIDGSASETVGMQIVSSADVTTNASSVKGTFPISGNLMTIASGTLAGVNFNATTTPAAASIDPQDGYTVWQNSTTITTRAVDMTRISFRRTGSSSDSDIKNWKLYVDGVQVGSAMQSAKNAQGDSYVTFDLSGAPKRLEAGTRVIKVLADIVGGSSLTLTTSLWNVADATFVDTQYYANVLAQANSATFSKRSSGEQTINSGTLTITKMTDSPSGDIVDGAANALLAKFQLKAAGEKVKISSLKVSAVMSDSNVGSLRNGALYANGVQIGSTTTLEDSTSSTTYNFGSSLIVEPGMPVTLEIKADIFDNDGTNNLGAADTIKVRIEGSSSEDNATGQVSSTTLDVPSTDTDANTVTVRQGTLTLSKYTAYTNHTVVAPLTAYKMGHYTLTASTSESVNITAINVAVDDVSGESNNIYVKLMDGSTTLLTTSTKATVAATNSWSVNHNLPAGKTIDVMVFMDIQADMSSGDGVVTTDIDGTTASSAVTADSSAVAGQTITFSSGSFATAFDGTPQNQVVSGNQSVLAGKFKLTSSYENYTVKEMRFKANSNPSVITSATIKDAATGVTLGTASYDNADSRFEFTGLSFAVPASTSKRIDLYWNLVAEPSATNANWNLDAKASLDYVKYADSQGAESETDTDRDGNTTLVYRAVPKIAKGTLTKAALINGQPTDLYKFTVTAPTQGPVHMKQIKIDVTWTDGEGATDSLEVESLKLYENGVDITTTVAIKDQTGGTVESTSGISEASTKILITWDDDTEESTTAAGTTTTYVIRGTPQGFNVTDAATYVASDSVSFQFVPDAAAQTSGYNFLNNGTAVPTSTVRLYSSSTANASAEDANLIWSDESAVAHSPDDDASTKDWSNSYLFSTVDAEAWTD